MDLIAILLGLVLAAGLVLFISRPLRQARQSGDAESRLDTLLTRRESLYTQIRELDFDHVTGKVTDIDHAPLRARLVDEAAEVLRQIDGLTQQAPPAAGRDVEAAIAARRKRQPAGDTDADLEAAIAARRRHRPAAPASSAEADLEAAIAARRKRQPVTQASSVEADLEAAIAARRKTLTCSNCGKPVNAGDAFCAKCGTPIGTLVAR